MLFRAATATLAAQRKAVLARGLAAMPKIQCVY
jgi:hypothetical protein